MSEYDMDLEHVNYRGVEFGRKQGGGGGRPSNLCYAHLLNLGIAMRLP